MSTKTTRLATALVAQLSLIMPHVALAGHGPGDKENNKPNFIPSSRSTPSGIGMVIRNEHRKKTSKPLTHSSSESKHDTWAQFEERGYKLVPAKHKWVTLAPDVDVESFALMNPELIDEEDVRMHKKMKNHNMINYYAKLFISEGIPEKALYLTPPPEWQAETYWKRNKDKIALEYPTLPDIESEDWQTLSPDEILDLDWDEKEDRKEIKMICLRHAYNLGIFDHTHYQNGDPEKDVVHERSALSWMPFPEEYSWSWRKFLELNPSKIAMMEEQIGKEAPLPKQALWTQRYAFHHGFDDNNLLVEGLPQGFSWRTYYFLLRGTDTSTLSSSLDDSSGSSPDFTDDLSLDDDYSFKSLPEYPDEQDLDDPETQQEMFKLALATQKHFVKYAKELGLLYPFLPSSFDEKQYLTNQDVRTRLKDIRGSEEWTKSRQESWAAADFFLRLRKMSDLDIEDMQEPLGFVLPSDWTSDKHLALNWELDERDFQSDFPEDDPYKEVKTKAWLQAAVSTAINVEVAHEDEDDDESTPHQGPKFIYTEEDKEKGLTRFAEVPENFDAETYLAVNPEREEELSKTLHTTHSGYDKLPANQKALLRKAAAEVDWTETKKPYVVIPSEFNARTYYKLNRGKIKLPTSLRTNEDKEAYLAEHFATIGLSEGLEYAEVPSGLKLPEWADVDYYLSQRWDLKAMAKRLKSSEAKQALVTQHYFTEGIQQGLRIANAPKAPSTMDELDAEYYAEQAPDLREMMEKLGKKRPVKQALVGLVSQHFAKIGRNRGYEIKTMTVIPASSMLPSESIGVLEDNVVHVFAGSDTGLITRSAALSLPEGSYQVQLVVQSPEEKGKEIGYWTLTMSDDTSSGEKATLYSNNNKVMQYPRNIRVKGGKTSIQVETFGQDGKELYIHEVRIRPIASTY